MVLSSKELTIIFIEFLVGILLIVLSFRLTTIELSLITTWTVLSVVIIVILALIFGIIYKRIAELDKALEKQEAKQKGLEEKFKRAEELIDIKANINYLKERCK